jgi:hypothetical protein
MKRKRTQKSRSQASAKPAKLLKSNSSQSVATLLNEPLVSSSFDFGQLRDDLTKYKVLELKEMLNELGLALHGKVGKS